MSHSVQRQVSVANPQGLHARPCAALMKTASEFASTVTVRNLENGVEANAKALLEIMMLIAPQGTSLQIEAEGDDAQAAVDAVVTLIENGFGES